MSRKKIGIIFGGRSAEHEVSVESAKHVLHALDTDLYEPILIAIDKSGSWRMEEEQTLLNNSYSQVISSGKSVPATMLTRGIIQNKISNNKIFDVAFPILHGPYGEDGTIQGLFELADIPYVGSSVLGSAIGMDKDVMKRLLQNDGVPIAPFACLHEPKELDEEYIFKHINSKTVFVKPANMGSSIGVSRVESRLELRKAVLNAFEYDKKVIIESAIIGDEIECSILGNTSPKASTIGRIFPQKGDFYSYKAKYIDENGAILEIPAKIDQSTATRAQKLALKVYRILECEGMARVDMFLTENDKIIVNEVNTIPGFTRISMYPKLWEASGLNYSNLITKLIEDAIDKHQKKRFLKSSYELDA